MRGLNSRFRVVLALCATAIVGALLINVLCGRRAPSRQRHMAVSTRSDAAAAYSHAPEFVSLWESGSHMERDEAMLNRIRHAGPRRPPTMVRFAQKIVHFDLKGAPLKVSYIEDVLPFLRQLGATGLLIEYEDMFPYEGPLASIPAATAYTKTDIAKILAAAKANDLMVIPLVQTFGHLEFVLKLRQYKELREVSHNPQALCPSRNSSVQLVHEMIRQMAEAHRAYAKYLHIGSDEVFVLGECDLCQNTLVERGWTKPDLFLSHVNKVVRQVTEETGLQVILWDDMFRQVDEETLRMSQLVKKIDIMVWNYGKTVNMAGVFSKYLTAGFRGIWVASAFKGASGPAAQLPDFRLHLLNQYSWVQLLRQFVSNEKLSVNFRGIALTGWQRYDHFGSLCELFPVGLPVLALCLSYLENGFIDDQALVDLRKTLKCNRILPVYEESSAMPSSGIGIAGETNGVISRSFYPPLLCDFPGSRVLHDVQQWAEVERKKQQLMSTNYFQGWLSNFNRRYKFSSPEHVIQGTRELPDLVLMCSRLREAVLIDFVEVTDKASALEWLANFLEPTMRWLEELQTDVQLLLAKDEWPRRPLLA